jgi:hypothetical protein
VQLTVGYTSRKEEEERMVTETTTDDSVQVRPALAAAQSSDLPDLERWRAADAERRAQRGEAGSTDTADRPESQATTK